MKTILEEFRQNKDVLIIKEFIDSKSTVHILYTGPTGFDHTSETMIWHVPTIIKKLMEGRDQYHAYSDLIFLEKAQRILQKHHLYNAIVLGIITEISAYNLNKQIGTGILS